MMKDTKQTAQAAKEQKWMSEGGEKGATSAFLTFFVTRRVEGAPT